MDNIWSLEYNGTTKTFEAWGLSGLRRTRQSAAADIVTFSHDGADCDADPLFPYNAKVVIWRDSVRWFTGWVRSVPRYGSPNSESIEYRLDGPWHFLERIEIDQNWPTQTGQSPGSSVIFGYKVSGGELVMSTTAEALTQILDYAIAAGAQFSYSFDTVDFALQPPATEEVDILCSEAIALVLRWHKDVVTWVDYSTATPVIHFQPHSDCSAESLNISSGESVESVSVRSREDLQVSGVLIRYNQTHSIDGAEYYAPTEDTAGTTTGLDVAKMSIAIAGSSLSYQRQEIVASDCPTLDSKIEELLLARSPELAATEIASLEWENHAYDFEGGHFILESGTVPAWVGETDSGSWSADCKITFTDGTVETRKVSCSETTTDAPSGKYRRPSSLIPGDPIPTGIAAELYAQLSRLQFEGSISIVDTELDSTLRPGKVLNLTGGRTEWTTMAAQIQQVDEDIETGRTTVTFGPPEHLTPQDFVELIRANRQRNNVVSSGFLKGDLGGSNTIDLDGKTPNTRTTSGKTSDQALTIKQTVDENDRTIKIDPASDGWKKGKGLYISDDESEMTLDYMRSVAPTEA